MTTELTFDVRIWETKVYQGKRKTSYYVRWLVAGKEWSEPFQNKGHADAFKSDLVSAARKGEAFVIESGLPVSMQRVTKQMSWYDFACSYVDEKWARVAATTRRTEAECLTAITMQMLSTQRGKPDDKVLRAAMGRWAFNKIRRDDPEMPREVKEALRWLKKHTHQVADLTDTRVLRKLLGGLTVNIDGTGAAATVVRRRRIVLNAAISFAIESKLLTSNPVPALKLKAPKNARQVDRRSVANPVQARTLLEAVRSQQRTGPRLVAFFGCLYFAGLRPEEAVSLKKSNLSLPKEGWGEIHLNAVEPHAGKEWTDSGNNRDRREQLKHRDRGESRTVPSPPELTALLHAHIALGVGKDGRLFYGERNKDELPKLTILKAWASARERTFVEEVRSSPLAATPYDLRHAAVSTWLNAGVPPTTVAAWAGHSVAVLLTTYAKCLDGEAQLLQHRVQAALGHG